MAVGKTPKGERTKNRITEVSIKLINDQGFNKVSLSDICTAAEVAPGTFYHYFTSTNDILKEVLKVEGEELIEYYRTLDSMSALQKLEKVLIFQLNYYEKKGKEVVAEIYKAELLSGAGSSNIDKLLPFQKFLDEIITEGQISGDFSTLNSPADNAVLIMSLIAYYSFRWIQDESKMSLEQTAAGHIGNIISQVIVAR